ncbi:hypothetical protein ACF1G5_24265 [Streptomyces coeruleorubidus]|uniref:hypothetical protein n=1 Tax=Streptomyces coeruleorubidus TaxID=116188 RepID=UPI0036F4FE72
MRDNRRLQSARALIAAGFLVGVPGATANAASTFPRQDPAQCTAFGKAVDARKAADTGKSVIGLWTGIHDLPEAQNIYDTYLTPGPVTHTYTEIRSTKALAEFRNAAETKKAVAGIVNGLKSGLTSAPPAFGKTYDLKTAGLGADVPIAWNDVETTPGFIAGGRSGVELADRTFLPDRRTITGNYSLVRTVSHGKTKAILHVRGLKLDVHDSVDFCPGNLGSGLVRGVSLGLSRLERTLYRDTKRCGPGAKCFYARPALFEATTPLNDVSVDVTGAFSAKAGATR